MKQVVIIGGGIAGLTAAIHLAERGLRPLLLEADPQRLGGRIKDGPTVEFNFQGERWRFPTEHGVHGIWSSYVNLKAVLARSGVSPDFVPAQDETWILGQGMRVRKANIGRAIRDSWIPAPFHYLALFTRPRFLAMINWRDVAAMFRVLGSLFAAMAIDPLAEQRSLRGMSLADFTRGWSPTLQNLFAGLARNALAAHPEDVPAAGFIAFLRFYAVMRRDAWRFSYLPGPGGTCLSEPLAAKARQMGAEIRLGACVQQLALVNAPPVWQIAYQAAGIQQIVEAQDVILALDAPAARDLLRVSPATANLAGDMRFPTGVPTAVIRLWYDRQPNRVSEAGIFSGDFIMDNFFWLDRLQQAYQAWRQATGGSAIEMHIYGPPELLAQPDALLLAQVIQDMRRAFPELRGHRRHTALLRNEATHTLFGVGEPDEQLTIDTPWPGMFACGDWISHPAPALYLERAVTTAVAAANAVLTGHNLETWPILAHPEPEWLAGHIAGQWTRLRQLMLRRKRRHKAPI